MKKISYICNRCGKEIRTEGARILPHFFDFATDGTLGEVEIPDNDVHFCMGCMKKVMEEILKLPEAGDGGDTEEGRDGKEKKTRPKKEKRLDAGKVMALHRAGWSNEQIAGEMGATERQVYQCIRYQNKKNNPGSEPDEKEREDEE